MLLTPTYHVFRMYRVHHDAKHLPASLSCPQYACGEDTMPAVSASVSLAADGSVNATLCNVDPSTDVSLVVEPRGMQPGKVSGEVLTAEQITDHNTFDEPTLVAPRPFTASRLTDAGVAITLPPKSVVSLRLE